MNDHHEKRHSAASHPPDDNDNSPELSDPDSPRRYISATRRDESRLAKAMDELNLFMMHIHGITPEEAAKRREKEIKQEERAAQEASRSKVMEWRCEVLAPDCV